VVRAGVQRKVAEQAGWRRAEDEVARQEWQGGQACKGGGGGVPHAPQVDASVKALLAMASWCSAQPCPVNATATMLPGGSAVVRMSVVMSMCPCVCVCKRLLQTGQCM